jgi:hypothetical protein
MKWAKIYKRIIFCIFIAVALILLWFLAVDESWFVVTCKDCFYDRDVIQYRIFTFPIHSKVREHNSTITFVAEELGLPCSHENLERWLKYRWWGFLFCYPRHSGISGFAGLEDSYKKQIKAKLKVLLDIDPNLPGTFQQRVLIEHDLDYWKELANKLWSQDGL